MTARMLARRRLRERLLSSARDPRPPATVSATTGTPTTGTFTGPDGIVYDYWKFTAASGSITFGSAGRIRLLVVAGGGGPGSDSGGGAGGLIQTDVEVDASEYPVVIGAGGAAAGNTSSLGSSGGDSRFAWVYALGGGGGGSSIAIGSTGGSAGGSSRVGGATSANTNYGRQGYGAASGVAGGGGAGGPGSAARGPGVVWLDGVTYAQGGLAGTPVVGVVANSGNGGNGSWGTSMLSGSSGVVIIAIPRS